MRTDRRGVCYHARISLHAVWITLAWISHFGFQQNWCSNARASLLSEETCQAISIIVRIGPAVVFSHLAFPSDNYSCKKVSWSRKVSEVLLQEGNCHLIFNNSLFNHRYQNLHKYLRLCKFREDLCCWYWLMSKHHGRCSFLLNF